MGYNSINREDPQAIEKLNKKLNECEQLQIRMKEVNAYYRKNGTVIGCSCLSTKQAETLDENVRRSYPTHKQPYPAYALTNNSAEIRRIKMRIRELQKAQETGYVGWEFEGGEVVPNTVNCRLQIFFNEKPDENKRMALKSRGFHWSPTENAWQRLLNDNALYAASRIEFLKPLDGSDPYKLQSKAKSEKEIGDDR